ncbi:hypothetical protein O0235_10520 [Tepidiforma flava]|uniref:N-acetyltransferase domain-containing protein n=1 Tax=Tepidiforma flava TaxID=3004094 RepID=A0ABY7M3U5_9CHLR|nr:hypothetical protein [Tepidiforma flava]WBL35221.1 hypothetical protein O0235_10520 [Tepidiforma flava]
MESVTLEVRVSNEAARALYRRYGFYEVGIRKRYYADNHEDAIIMTTERLDSPPYRERLERLRADLAAPVPCRLHCPPPRRRPARLTGLRPGRTPP